MNTALAEREELEQAIRSLPDQQVRAVLEFVRDLEEEEHVPNAETIKVLKDSEAGRNVIGPFHNMEDFVASLLSDNDA
jgi:hypothetical protein